MPRARASSFAGPRAEPRAELQATSDTLARVPPHLRRYVVTQDYTEYTAVDQAVWRFVLLQMYDKLRHTAHSAYHTGLTSAGISVERIPSLDEMNRCLSRFGWGAVAVDGFIPPRAFTEFQAAGILPICAEIRSADHLVYTPAPDIIHEAAGHAPIIVDPKYASYLRQIGEVGARAFSLPEDTRVYQAIFALSEVKERPGATQAEIEASERALALAGSLVSEVSEASRVSRLYWWTAEYGLVGKPQHYKLYGAGLLSSLGESHTCQESSVAKLPLSAACSEVGYDITRAQPQLFVAEDFDQLAQVLDEVAATLAFRTGGKHALDQAHKSGELCTLSLDTGLEVIGEVKAARTHENLGFMLARVAGHLGFTSGAELLSVELGPERQHELWLLIGVARDAASLAGREPTRLEPGARFRFELGQGYSLQGRFRSSLDLGPSTLVEADGLGLWQGLDRLERQERAWLLFAGRLAAARAGSADPAYYASSQFGSTRAPLPRTFPAKERALMELYGQALEAHQHFSTPLLVHKFAQIHETLNADFPHDWLLRWNLLESLVKRSERGALASKLHAELEQLEHQFLEQQPIASGLRYLGYR